MSEYLILVAEDERDIREFLAMALQVSGFHVVEARNGEEAIALAASHTPDLILLDIRMPKVTGFQACEALKSDPNTKDIPIIFLSAYANQDEIQRGLALGADEYLTKPIGPDVLTQRVTDVLRQSGPQKTEVRVSVPA
jgi:two-component system alkaline phosphatase synthesis response regulator PhoP